MISEKNRFPIDIFEVKKYGIDKWQNEFFWPVSDKDFVNLSDDIEQCLRKHINTQPEEISDLLLISCVLRSEYWHFLHALKVIDKIKEIGKDILYSEKSSWYKEIMAGGLETIRISGRETVESNLAMEVKIKVAKFLRNIIYNFSFLNFFSLIEKKEVLEVYGSMPLIVKKYIKRLPHLFHFSSKRDWLPEDGFHNIPNRLSDSIGQTSKTIANELKSIAHNNEIRLHDHHVAYLEKQTESILTNAAKMLYLIRSKKGDKKVRLLASGFGDFFSRSLYITIQQQGGKVTSFSHGGNIGLYDTPSLTFSEFALSGEFVTYTQKSVELFEKIKSNQPVLRNNKVNIKSCDSDQFFKLWQRYGNKPLPERIKRVMIVGYPHNQWRKPQASGGFSLMQLDLELRIVNILAKAGYYILYKAHPDRIAEVEGIFEDKTKVLKSYFQNYLDMADAFLFGSIRTTAFPVALCANKPIIAFKMEDEPYKPFSGAMELLQKRCSIIHAKFDERNRIIFDEEELLTALSQEPKQPNTEFVEKYYFPG